MIAARGSVDNGHEVLPRADERDRRCLGHVETNAHAVPDADNMFIAEIHRRQVPPREYPRRGQVLEISAVDVDALRNVDRPRARSSECGEVTAHTKFLADIAGQ